MKKHPADTNPDPMEEGRGQRPAASRALLPAAAGSSSLGLGVGLIRRGGRTLLQSTSHGTWRSRRQRGALTKPRPSAVATSCAPCPIPNPSRAALSPRTRDQRWKAPPRPNGAGIHHQSYSASRHRSAKHRACWIHGLVKRPLVFTLDSPAALSPSPPPRLHGMRRQQRAVLFDPPRPGRPCRHYTPVVCADGRGVKLSLLLEECGIDRRPNGSSPERRRRRRI